MREIGKFLHYCGTHLSITFLTLWATTFAAEYTYNRLQPDSYFIEYFSVELREPPASLTDPMLHMQSVGIIRREIDVTHHDVLRCQTPEGDSWRFVSQQTVTVRYSQKTYLGFESLPEGSPDDVNLVSGRWDYRGAKPRSASLCKIEANITVRPSIGVEKRLQLESSSFQLL